MIRPLAFAAILALAACARSEEANLVAVDENASYNVADQVSTQVIDENAPSLGEWTLSMQAEKPALQFGAPQTEPLFSLRCDTGGGLILQRHGIKSAGKMEMMNIEIDATARRLAVEAVEGPLPLLTAAVRPNSDLIGALRDAKSPIIVRLGDGPPLVMPPSPTIGSFIQSCAGGEAASAPDEAANATAPVADTATR